MRAESPPTASGLGSTRPMCWHAPSGSTWSGAGWKPTIDNYLGRVTKPRILEAVREAMGEPSAQLIDHLKKGDMAKEAERLLDGSGWLPEPLRLVDIASAPAELEGEAGPLPEFLSDRRRAGQRALGSRRHRGAGTESHA